MKHDTQILKVDSQNPDADLIQTAARVIQSGGLVAFPTETVYGLGANALNKDAVDRIFAAKERPANDPVIVHIAEVAQIQDVAVNIPDLAYQLAEAFFPGALTLILHKHSNIPANITAGRDTVAVRMPSHAVAHALIQASGVPIGAPSANRFSRPSPTTAEHVFEDLRGRVEIILDAGATTIGVESTILDLTSDKPVVLRPGGVPLEALQQFIPGIGFHPQYLPESVTAAPSPGTLLKHYSPTAELLLFDGDSNDTIVAKIRHTAQKLTQQGKQVGIMANNEDMEHYLDLPIQTINLGNSAEEMANSLFQGMRELDMQGVDVILVRAPQESGLGLAVRDRLIRAANGKIIQA